VLATLGKVLGFRDLSKVPVMSERTRPVDRSSADRSGGDGVER
jgi:hypothetical protein